MKYIELYNIYIVINKINNMGDLNYNDKVKKFSNKNGRTLYRYKTELNELPLRLEIGSSTQHPDKEGGWTTSDSVLWCKFLNAEWFKPYGGFSREQIISMIDICKNDLQVISFMELLAAGQ